MNSRWEKLRASLKRLLIGVVIVLVLWIPFYLLLAAWILPWLIAGFVVGLLLAFFWEKHNPFRMKKLF